MNIKLSINVKRVIFVFVILWCFAFFQNALELKKECEWSFDGGPQLFIFDGKLHVWAGRSLYLYPENKEKELIVRMKKGEGPGDCLIVNKVDYHEGQYIFWDRWLKRMTFFSKEGKLIRTQRFKMPMLPILIGKVEDNYIFKWSAFQGMKSSRLIIEQVGAIKGEDKKILVEVKGKLNKGKIVNSDRPMLIYSFSDNKLFYAKNREYIINVMDLLKKNPVSSLYASKDYRPLKWKEEYADIQYDIFNKPQRIPEYRYPDYVPPLFALAASGDLIVAVTNEQIEKRKAVIDVFQKGKYMGSAEIPLLYQQYFIFPSFLNFPPDIQLYQRSLYTVHYFDDLEVYKIIKWKISFE